jgi:anthranilate/para-aminobenzoate synthase component I
VNVGLLADGPVLAPSSLTAGRLARSLSESRLPLMLASSEERGWFGGAQIACWDPVCVATHLTLGQASDTLERVMRGQERVLAAAVLTYEGAAEVRTYTGGVQLAADGWRAWGTARELPVPPNAEASPEAPGPVLLDVTADLDESGYLTRVDRIRERIAAGDVYVLNLTYRLSGRPALDPAGAFAVLLERAAGPMSAWWGDPSRSLVSVSPERFCAVESDAHGQLRAWIEPIKGTRPRDRDPRRDAELARELAADAKERAEHVMIVDLERNDLGRVAVPGSVRVDPMLEVFSTPYCHQLVSRVEAVLSADAGLADLVASTFPCGSVTGAPKRAAMRVIAELECSPRGAYTGALLVALPGRLDSSVLIRTLEYDGPHAARWGTGCGITIDSDPNAEWRESRLKAVPVLAAASAT